MYAAGNHPQNKGKISLVAGEGVRYVCPHHITVTGEDEQVRLYFRVTEPGKKTRLRAVCGDKEVSERTVRRVSPGEMEHIDVNTKDLINDVLVISTEGVK